MSSKRVVCISGIYWESNSDTLHASGYSPKNEAYRVPDWITPLKLNSSSLQTEMMLGRQWHNETLFWVPETNFKGRYILYMLSFNVVPFQNHPYLSAFLLVLERDQTKNSKPAIGNTIVKMGLLQQLLVLQVGCFFNPRCWWLWNLRKTWNISHGEFCQFWRGIFFHDYSGFPPWKGPCFPKKMDYKKFHSFKPQMLDRRGAKASKRSSATWKGEVIQVHNQEGGHLKHPNLYKDPMLPQKSTKSS